MQPSVVQQFMTHTPHSIDEGATLDLAAQRFEEYSIRHLPVTKEGRLAGLLSARDVQLIASLVDRPLGEIHVGLAMSPLPYTVTPETPLAEAAANMARRKLGSAVVVKNLKVVGIFTSVDACRALAQLA